MEEGVLGRGGKGIVLRVRHVLDGVSLGHFACKRVPVGVSICNFPTYRIRLTKLR